MRRDRRQETGKMTRLRDNRDDDVQKCCCTLGIEKYTNFLHTQKQTGDFHPHPFIQQSNTYSVDMARERR